MLDKDVSLTEQIMANGIFNKEFTTVSRLDVMMEARTETQHWVNDNYPDENFKVQALYPTEDVNDWIVSFSNDVTNRGGYAYYRSYYGVENHEVQSYSYQFKNGELVEVDDA